MNDLVTREEMERYTETAAIIADNAENAKRRCAVFPLYLVRGLIRVCKDREEPKFVKVNYEDHVEMNPAKGIWYTCPRCFSRLKASDKPDYCGRCGQRIAWFEGAGIRP